MPLESASSLLLFAVTAAAIALLIALYLRWRQSASVEAAALNAKISTLENLLQAAREEAQRLERAIEHAQALGTPRRLDALATIENLGDQAMVADSTALARTAQQLTNLPTDLSADLFAADHQLLSVARLADQGHTASDIARRLGKSIGDVELLLSLRPA